MSTSPSSADATMRIGAVSRRTGVSEATLRAWERRYGILEPRRTPGGHRLYSELDVARVASVQRLVEQGWAVGAAARQVATAGKRRKGKIVAHKPAPGTSLSDRLQAALDSVDPGEVATVLDEALDALDTFTVLDDLLSTAARRLQRKRPSDPLDVARQRFGVHYLRARALALVGQGPGDAGSCVAACPEGEIIDVDLAVLAAALDAGGWRVAYLGPNVPTDAIAATAADRQASVVLVSASTRTVASRAIKELGEGDFGLLLAGEGFDPADAGPRRSWFTGPLRGAPAAATALADLTAAE